MQSFAPNKLSAVLSELDLKHNDVDGFATLIKESQKKVMC